MSNGKFSVPNWMQAKVAEAIGLDPKGVVVRLEDESRIVFLVHKTREEYSVNKTTGNVVVS